MKSLSLSDKIETILFLESEPISISDLAKNLEIKEEKCLEEVEKIHQKYQDSRFVWDLVFNREQVQLVIKKRFSSFIKKYFNRKNQNSQLSPTMLEVLSIILYRSPISKIEIEKIRGINSDLVLRKLAIKGLIEKKEKVKKSGVFLYSPSLKLMKKIGISRLENLPDYDKLSKEFKKVETFLN
jgi:segregation and condensation protein B